MSSTVVLFANCRPTRRTVLRFLSTLTLAGLYLTATVGQSVAQVATGEVQGTVFTTDPDGTRSPIPGAKVALRGPGSPREAVADQHAVYHFSGLTPGEYQIEA